MSDKQTNLTAEEATAIIEREIACVNKECNIERACGQCELVMPSKEPIIEAYKLAIEALKTKPCDDCISRQAVLDIVNNPLNIKLDEIIKKLPPVVPQPKTGYWISWYEIIEEEWGTEHNPHCKCSECGTEVDPHTSQFINCCPVCGAKMVGYKKREEDEANERNIFFG